MAEQGQMKAFVLHGLGSTDHIKPQSVAKPVPGKGEILIKVAAVDVNPGECKIRNGQIPGFFLKMGGATEIWPPKPGPHRPYIMGVDASGIVEQAPAGSRFKKGARVVVRKTDFAPGALCEYTAAKEADTALLPDSVSMVDAVAAAAVGLTAVQAFKYLTGPAAVPGASVLVNGGSGGVGHIFTQMAVQRGLKVTATASAGNAERVRSLGAETVLDYTKVDYYKYALEKGGFDAVLDTVGNNQNMPPGKMLKKGGVFVRLATGAGFKPIANMIRGRIGRLFGGMRYEMLVSLANGKELEGLMGEVGAGKIKVHVDKTFPFDQAAQAHKYAEDGLNRNGKVVIVVDPTLK